LAAFEAFGRDSKWQRCVATADKRKAGAAVIIHVDTSRCTGHAQCNSVAAEIYELDDLGYCAVDGLKVSSDQELQVLRGAEACPERAIDVETSPASEPD
jgi:ferredoxin